MRLVRLRLFLESLQTSSRPAGRPGGARPPLQRCVLIYAPERHLVSFASLRRDLLLPSSGGINKVHLILPAWAELMPGGTERLTLNMIQISKRKLENHRNV